MSTHITQSLQKRNKGKILFFAICISLLSVYPIYKNFYNGAAVTTYERHIALVEGRSEYYNPWQYRMLCPLIIEGLMWTYNNTIDRVYPIEEKFSFQFRETSEPTPETKEFLRMIQTKGALKYMIVFIFFRFCLNVLVFLLAYRLWRYFISNKWLIFSGLILLSLAMGNAVIASDLTFNTYLDNIFYLLTACLIVYRKNPLLLIPLTILAAFNRETAMLIPFLYFISQIDFSGFAITRFNISSVKLPKPRLWVLTAGLYALFFTVFIALRMHYGYVEQQIWKVPSGLPMVKLNLFSSVGVKSYFEMIGVFSVIPLIILYKFKSFPLILQVWFTGIVPIWFAVHIYSVVIYQTRLFLVPVILIFIPMFLWLIENEYAGKKDIDVNSLKNA
ncbi:MAG: hypothetical protein IPN39_11760 [Chitinophagaceae bacterium]|nr:hypothetical protein [Chitinophagaceae bacterium]